MTPLRELSGEVAMHLTPRASGLAALGLTSGELLAIAQQGFVSTEHRSRRGPYYKLRFRMRGRQVVRYLGRNPAVAEQVRQEVSALQAGRRRAKELKRATREAWSTLRRVKRDLQVPMAAAGYAFHGLNLRKKRAVPQSVALQSTASN